MKAQKYFIFSDTSLDEHGCDMTGSRWINGQCYCLAKAYKPLAVQGASKTYSYLDKKIILYLDDPNKPYKFDVVAFYQNAIDCQNNGGGDVDLKSLKDAIQGYPRCFVNIPVITAEMSPCQDQEHDWSSVGFDEQFCAPCKACKRLTQ